MVYRRKKMRFPILTANSISADRIPNFESSLNKIENLGSPRRAAKRTAANTKNPKARIPEIARYGINLVAWFNT